MRAVFALLSTVVLCVAAMPVAFAAGPETAANQAEINKNVIRRAFQALETADLKTLNEVYDPQGPIHTPQGKTVL